MFENIGPVAAASVMQEFMEDHGSELAPALKEKLRERLREISPVPKLLGGMEVLYVLATEKPLTTSAGREATFHALGIAATAVGTGQFGGAESRDRAWALASWAAHKLSPVGPEPAAPDVDPAYSTIEVESAPAPPPVLEQPPA